MKFSRFSEYLKDLESTTKRLEITSILADLIEHLDPSETAPAIYLTLGTLQAPFDNPKFNMADKMVIRVLENVYRVPKDKVSEVYNRTGDLGDTAYELAGKSEGTETEIAEMHRQLTELAMIVGSGSQEAKVTKMSGIMEKADPLSAKYLVRIVLGTTRLGFTELTIVDALNKFIGGDKKTAADIEYKYNIHPDMGLIAAKIKSDGLKGINSIKIETGVPILPQKAQRMSDPEEIVNKMGGKVSAEYKFDGTRVQLHLDRNKKVKSKDLEQNNLFDQNKDEIFIKTFTRNLEENSHQYPDLVLGSMHQIDAESAILDGEAIGYDKQTGEFLPFQEIMQRKRKHDVAEMAKEIPLKYFVFDLLYLNGKPLIDETLETRRETLKKILKEGKVLEIDTRMVTDNPEELASYFEEAKEKGLEGLVIKKPDAPYQAGARAYTWVKLKRSDTSLLKDTVDGVVLGYSYGKGARSSLGIGTFLVGVYDEKNNIFKTFTSVGTGLKEDDFRYLKKEADRIKVAKKPANIDEGKVPTPDVWITPKIVVELGGDEISKSSTHSSGYALRFPRLLKFRTDRRPEDATTLSEIANIYKLQKRGYYNSKEE